MGAAAANFTLAIERYVVELPQDAEAQSASFAGLDTQLTPPQSARQRIMGGVSQIARTRTTNRTQSARIASLPEERFGFWRWCGPELFGV
jgi:hypothetical protein